MNTNEKGDIGEIRIAYEAQRRGYKVAFPFGHDWKYDLIVERSGRLERVQVKTVISTEEMLQVNTYSLSKHVNGKKKAVLYSPTDFDWIAIYDIRTDECFFIPSSELPGTMTKITLRYQPPRNNRWKGVRMANDFKEWPCDE